MEDNCQSEIESFCRSGLPGMARLKEVLPSLFVYYKVSSMAEKERMLAAAGLEPMRDGYGDVTFNLPRVDGFQDFQEWPDPQRGEQARPGTGLLSPS